MVLDVSQLIQNDGAVKKLDFSISMDNLSFNGQDIAFTSPFFLTGEIYTTETVRLTRKIINGAVRVGDVRYE